MAVRPRARPPQHLPVFVGQPEIEPTRTRRSPTTARLRSAHDGHEDDRDRDPSPPIASCTGDQTKIGLERQRACRLRVARAPNRVRAHAPRIGARQQLRTRCVGCEQHGIERTHQGRNDRPPRRRRRIAHHHESLECQTQLGRGRQPERRQSHDRHPRAGCRRTGEEGQRQRGGRLALHAHGGPPLQRATRQQLTQGRENRQHLLAGQHRGPAAIDDLPQLGDSLGAISGDGRAGNGHHTSIEHLFALGKASFGYDVIPGGTLGDHGFTGHLDSTPRGNTCTGPR